MQNLLIPQKSIYFCACVEYLSLTREFFQTSRRFSHSPSSHRIHTRADIFGLVSRQVFANFLDIAMQELDPNYLIGFPRLAIALEALNLPSLLPPALPLSVPRHLSSSKMSFARTILRSLSSAASSKSLSSNFGLTRLINDHLLPLLPYSLPLLLRTLATLIPPPSPPSGSQSTFFSDDSAASAGGPLVDVSHLFFLLGRPLDSLCLPPLSTSIVPSASHPRARQSNDQNSPTTHPFRPEIHHKPLSCFLIS